MLVEAMVKHLLLSVCKTYLGIMFLFLFVPVVLLYTVFAKTRNLRLSLHKPAGHNQQIIRHLAFEPIRFQSETAWNENK